MRRSKICVLCLLSAIAVQFVLDKEKQLALAFKTNDIPVRYKTRDELLEWQKKLELGQTEGSLLKRQQANADGKGGDGEAEVDARYELARALVKKGAYAEATEHYVWLWENIPRKHPAMHGVRSSFMIGQMARLLSNFPAARVAFERLRVEALKSTSKSGDRDDWIVLNSLLGHDDETLDWFDKSKNDSKQKEAIRKSDFRLDDILIRNMRWADLIFMYPRPLVKLKELHEFAQEVNTSLKTRKSTGGETRDYDPFPKDAALIYAGYLAAGQDQIAEHIAERALELCNTPAMRQQLLAKSLLAHQRKPQLHINWGDEQLQLARKGSGPHLRQGCRFCDSSEFDHALNEFDAAEKAQDNGLSKALMLRGATYVLLRQVDRGIDDLNRAIEIAPTVAFAHRWRGWAHASKFEFDKAIQDYSKAIELDPKDAFAYSGRGRMLWTQHKLRAAIQDLDKSIVFDPSNAEAYFLRAACYKQSEDYASALGDIDQSLKLNPNDREAQYQRASILDGVKKYEEALAACNRLIESAPKNSQNYTQRATYQTKMNLFDAAINDFGKAASLDPNDALIPLYQAGVLMHVGRLKEAVAAITKSIETDPTNASAYSCRAHVFIMMDDYKSAMDDLNLGIERDPSFGNGAAYFMRAQVHEKLGETKAAESDRQEAKKLGYTDEGDAE